VSAQTACAACVAQPGPAQPQPVQRARPTAWPSSARRERARSAAAMSPAPGGGVGKSTAGPHRCVDGGAVELTV
jgi:hypothetical protein